MPKERRKKSKGKNQPIFTQIGYTMGIVGGIILIYLSLANIDEEWGQFGLIQVFFIVWGTFGIVRFTEPKFIPTKWNENDYNNIAFDTIIIFGLSILSQIISRLVFEVTTTERALYWLAGAVAEEIFFRGYLLNLILNILNRGKTSKNIGSKDEQGKRIYGKVGVNEITAISVQAFFFAAIHVNYYDRPEALFSVFLGGFLLGLGYVVLRNLTANILAHFFLNLWAAWSILLQFSIESENVKYLIGIIACLLLILCPIYIQKIKQDKEKIKYYKQIKICLFSGIIIGICMILYFLNNFTIVFGPAELI